MRKILSKTQKVELNTFIEQFVKARQKYFIPEKEWLEADLAGEEWIQKEHLSEAFGYRALEERIWGQKH